jgi:serine/threonine protein kinase/tetratricopeptide (TPR) repeat protein
MAADSSDRFVLLNQLAEDFAARYRRGERPSLREYIDRHPELADDIREFFPALAEMEQVKEDRREIHSPVESGPLPPLQQLGDFRIVREIGRGGMGVVYEAEQVSLGRRVALKVLSQQLPDERARRRFEREAKAAARLHHTNIVPVFGVGEHDGLPYYVMQFIQGLGLDEVLRELRRLQLAGPEGAGTPSPVDGESRATRPVVLAAEMVRSLMTGQFAPAEAEGDSPDTITATVEHLRPATAVSPPPVSGRASDLFALSSTSLALPVTGSGQKRSTYWQSVARVGVQVADALEHARQQGIQHRDIKPSNLLLDRQGTVWVTDFGLAKADDQQDLTHTGDIVGTLRYLAPERFSGWGDVRADVYALGLTLYEMLTLRPAFAETDRNRLVKQVMNDEPARPRKVNPAVPRDLETIVLQATARDPAHRYQTPGALADDLKRFLEDRPILARQSGPVERTVRWCRRNKRVALLLGLVAFLLGALGVGGIVAAIAFNAQADYQRDLATKAETARGQAEDAKEKAQKEAVRANEEALRATQVTNFLVGLFKPRDRLVLANINLGFLDKQDALPASALLKRGVKSLIDSAELSDRPLIRAQLLHEVGGIYMGLGNPGEAGPLLEEAWRLRRAHLPADHPDLAPSLRAVAEVQLVREELPAIDLLREVLALLRRQPELDELEVARAETGLAIGLWHLTGEEEESVRLFQSAIGTMRRRLGDSDPQTLTTLFLFIRLRIEKGEYLATVPLVAQLQDGLRQCKADPELVACIRATADSWQTLWLLGKAAAIGPTRKALSQVAKVFGGHHYLTLFLKAWLAELLYESEPATQRTLEEALALYRECRAGHASWGVPARSLKAATCLNMGRTLLRLGTGNPERNTEAEAVLREAAALYRAGPAVNRPSADLPHTLQMLAWAVHRQKDPAKHAEVGQLLEESLAYCRAHAAKVLHYRQAFAHMDAGHWRLLAGDAETAAPLFAEALTIWRKKNDPVDFCYQAETLALRYAALRQQGKADEAEAARREAEAVLRRTNREVPSVRGRVGELLAGRIPSWGG